jgi:peptidoglycan/xylan/chitin deacetylase (PgdA/CDA1 family)
MFEKYIIRIDDACPTMNHQRWNRLEKILNNYKIKPIVAVIPRNQDKKLMIDLPNSNFWQQVKRWQNRGWEIALHGFEHKYSTKSRSLVPINNYSEFAGVPLNQQKEKIREGLKIFKEHNIVCRAWIAPAHSFDENTIKALQSESDITIISDGIAWSPYYKYNMYWIPQQLWKPRKMPFGTWTICYHPDEMSDKDFEKLEDFLEQHYKKFISVDDLNLTKKPKSITQRVFEKIYWKLLEKKRKKAS